MCVQSSMGVNIFGSELCFTVLFLNEFRWSSVLRPNCSETHLAMKGWWCTFDMKIWQFCVVCSGILVVVGFHPERLKRGAQTLLWKNSACTGVFALFAWFMASKQCINWALLICLMNWVFINYVFSNQLDCGLLFFFLLFSREENKEKIAENSFRKDPIFSSDFNLYFSIIFFLQNPKRLERNFQDTRILDLKRSVSLKTCNVVFKNQLKE